MKRIKFLQLFLMIMLFVGANNAFAQMQEGGAQEEYMGVIGKDLYINMTLYPLQTVGSLVSYEGNYSYAKTGGMMTITGKINKKTGTFAFTEKNESGTTTGFFNGKKKGDKVAGKWTSFDQKTNFTFDLAIKR